MLKLIRWQGIVAFAVLVAVVAAFWLLVIDGLVESAIEKVGTWAVGARVDLRSADVSFMPLGLELSGLEVTDPDRPMTNAIEVRRAAFELETVNLVLGRVIIDEVTMEGVQLGTQRTTSGAIEKKARKERRKGAEGKEAEGTILGSIDIPNVDDILKREELQTVKLAQEFSGEIKEQEKQFKDRIAELPDEETIKEYEKRVKEIEKLAKKGFPAALEAAAKADELQKDIDGDLKRIKRLERDLKKTIADLEARLKDIKNAPTQDISRLQKKYALTGGGAVNASRLLLGPVVGRRLESVLSFWEKYGPIAERIKQAEKGEKKPERGKGINVRFPERNPMPAFLVRKALLTAEHRGSAFSGEVANITFEQEKLGRPLTYDLSGKDLGWADSLGLHGTLDRTDPASPLDTLEAELKGYDASGLELAGGESLPVTFNAGGADLDFRMKKTSSTLDARAEAYVTGIRLTLDTKQADLGRLTQPFQRALASIQTATVEAKAAGTRDDYTVTVTSDVDDKLKSAISDVVKQQVKEFENELEARVRQAVADPISGLDGELDVLRLQDVELGKAKDSLDGLLSRAKLF